MHSPGQGFLSSLTDIVSGFKGKPDDLMNSEAMQTLIKEGLVRVGKDGRTIVAANRERGLVEYLDPMASIFHLVSPLTVLTPCHISYRLTDLYSMHSGMTTKQPYQPSTRGLWRLSWLLTRASHSTPSQRAILLARMLSDTAGIPNWQLSNLVARDPRHPWRTRVLLVLVEKRRRGS